MGKKNVDQSDTNQACAGAPNQGQPDADSMSDIPEFTPEQWEWLKEQSGKYEEGYVPTRSLIPGL